MYLTCELSVSAPKEDKMLVCLTPSSNSSPRTEPGTVGALERIVR